MNGKNYMKNLRKVACSYTIQTLHWMTHFWKTFCKFKFFSFFQFLVFFVTWPERWGDPPSEKRTVTYLNAAQRDVSKWRGIRTSWLKERQRLRQRQVFDAMHNNQCRHNWKGSATIQCVNNYCDIGCCALRQKAWRCRPKLERSESPQIKLVLLLQYVLAQINKRDDNNAISDLVFKKKSNEVQRDYIYRPQQ